MLYLVAPERRKWFLVKTPLFESGPYSLEDYEKDPDRELEKDPLVRRLMKEHIGFVAVPFWNTGGNNDPFVYGADATGDWMEGDLVEHLADILESGDFYGRMLESAEAVALMDYISGTEHGEEDENE